MPISSQIVINDVTVVDLARYSFAERGFLGDSFSLHCALSGSVDPQEGVVVDFSSGKRVLKSAIDHHHDPRQFDDADRLLSTNGLDHKLLLPAAARYRELTKTEAAQFESERFLITRTSDTHCQITSLASETFRLELPLNAVRTVPADVLFDLDSERLTPLQNLLADHLAPVLPGVTVRTVVDRTPQFGFLDAAISEPRYIGRCRYTHGLPNSSAHGCQNILHGHHSYVVSADPEEAQRVSDYLDHSYLYHRRYESAEKLAIEYTTDQRGSFCYTPDQTHHRHFIDVGADSTIEHMAAHVASHLSLRAPFFLSEGLQKGCLVSR